MLNLVKSTDMRCSVLDCETAKALELFMASIVEETVKETRSRGAKKMTPYHV